MAHIAWRGQIHFDSRHGPIAINSITKNGRRYWVEARWPCDDDRCGGWCGHDVTESTAKRISEHYHVPIDEDE